ncbi:MAG: hypothetical protein ABIH46_02775 [Chloroflexota bacterium]
MKVDVGPLERISELELLRKLRRGVEFLVVDAREEHVFGRSNVKPRGSMHIAPGASIAGIERIPRDRPVVTVCT